MSAARSTKTRTTATTPPPAEFDITKLSLAGVPSAAEQDARRRAHLAEEAERRRVARLVRR